MKHAARLRCWYIPGDTKSCFGVQITTEAGKEGNYSSELTVVTVEPGGLTGRDESKIRMLLVRVPPAPICLPDPIA